MRLVVLPHHVGVELGDARHGEHDVVVLRPPDRDAAVLEWLSQALERFAPKLGHFVEKQDTVVCEGDLAGADGSFG